MLYNIHVVSARKTPVASDRLVYRLAGPKASLLGTVKAPNCEAAQAIAYDEFAVPEAERKRMIVQRAGDHA